MFYITNNKILYFITIILTIIVVCFMYYTYNANYGSNFKEAQVSNTSSTVISNITNHVNVYQGTTVQSVKLSIPNVSGYYNNDAEEVSDNYTTYTYENFFNNISTNKPRVQNVITDLLAGFNHISYTSSDCLDRDQLSVQYSNRICNNNNRCISQSGNKYITQTSDETYYQENPDITYCTNSMVGSLSFNFRLDAISGYVDISTAFLNIDYVACGSTAYTTINTADNTFFLDNDLFINESNEADNDYIPILQNKVFSTNNIKQNFRITRYDFSLKEDINGSLAEMVFRPGNFYFTAIGTQTGIISINNFSIPDSGFTNQNTIRYIKQTNNTGKGAKCFIVNGTYKIIDPGENYESDLETQIQNDSGEWITIGGDLKVGFAYRFKLMPKNGSTLSESVNWWLIPPTELTVGSIPKTTKLKNGSIKSFTTQTDISALKLIDNLKTSGLPAYQTIVQGNRFMPLPVSQNVATITYNDDNTNLILDAKTIFNDYAKLVGNGSTIKNLKISSVSYNSNIYNEYPPYIYTATESGIPEDRDFFSQIYFNGVASSSIISNLISVINATTAGGAAAAAAGIDTTVLTTLGPLVPVEYVASLFFDGNRNISITTTSLDQELSSDVVDPDLINDGTAVWRKTDAFLNILAFSKEYFNNSTLLNGGPATQISNNIQPSEVNFRYMAEGIISSVDISNATYNSISFNLNLPSYVVDVNNDNFSLTSGGSISGENGQVYVTFTGTPYKTISSIIVQQGGTNYIDGNYTMNASAISSGLTGTISNIFFTTTSDTSLIGNIYQAVAVDINGNPYNINNNTNIKNYGLTIGVSSNGRTTILNGGNGYIENDKVYINQLDNNLNSLLGDDYDPSVITLANMQKLPYIIVLEPNQTQINQGSCLNPATRNLLFNLNDTVLAEYNFWEDSPGVYENCPQQIALMDAVHREYYTNQGICISNGIFDMLNTDKVQGFTNIENLKTIQFQELNYRSDGMSANINGNSYLELGRFIPYQSLQPPEATPGVSIAVKPGSATWINYNYCQFVPYGVQNLYQKRFGSYSNLPTF